VDRERGAFELSITPLIWDEWVSIGRLPPPAPGFPEDVPRWRWIDIDRKMSGRKARKSPAAADLAEVEEDPFVRAAKLYGLKLRAEKKK
jgi:hypothetical protein